MSSRRVRLSRREWLAGTGAAWAAAAIHGSGGVGQSVATHSSLASGIIDSHVHVWPAHGTAFPLAPGFTPQDLVPATFTPDELLEHCRPLGVDRIVLIQMSYYGTDNAYMLQAMAAHPGKFSGVAVIDADSPHVVATMKSLQTQGIRGYRLIASAKNVGGWPGSSGIEAMFRCGAETQQAMCCLADPEALSGIDAMCQRFPHTPVVIDHFARIGMKEPPNTEQVDALCRLSRFKNVYVKTSAFYALGSKSPPYTDLLPLVRRLKEAFGADRLMWGSDAPYQVQSPHTYGASLALLRDHADFLTDSERQAILGGTADKVFFRPLV